MRRASLLVLVATLSFFEMSCADAIKEGLKDFKSANEQHDAGLNNSDIDGIPIKIDDLPAGIAGVCVVFNGGVDPDITLSREFFKLANFEDKVATVMHELGHCSLGRDHTSDMIGNRPASLMNPAITDEMNYGDHKSSYQEEMMTNTDEFFAIF